MNDPKEKENIIIKKQIANTKRKCDETLINTYQEENIWTQDAIDITYKQPADSRTPLLYLGPDFVLFLDVTAATESFVLCIGFKKSLRSNWYRGERVILIQRVNNTFSKNLHIEVKDSLKQ